MGDSRTVPFNRLIAEQFKQYPELFGQQKFKFEIHVVADGKYGRKVPCGNVTILDRNGKKVTECWDGMIWELQCVTVGVVTVKTPRLPILSKNGLKSLK